MSNSKEEIDFENEVRRIARAKWPSAKYSGAQLLDGRERDGVFETDESINFVEATVSAGTGKALEDSKKMHSSIVDFNKKGHLKAAIGWFVTKNEPTADQRRVVQDIGKGQIRAISFAQFQQSIVDVRAYLAARENHAFGSVRDFIEEKKKTPSVEFVDIGLKDVAGGPSMTAKEIAVALESGERFVLVGQYGAGKSMTLRQIHILLQENYKKGKSPKFPVYINLREHSGQRNAVEIIERHARGIGFDSTASLIRAWRAGFAILLIDGFDEVTSLGVQGSWKKLKDLRVRSLEGARHLVKDSPGIGIAISGRSHYFENEAELRSALGVRDAKVLAIDEFTGDQIAAFLAKFPGKIFKDALPEWIPTRPLLLGYLASKNLLEEVSGETGAPDSVEGWDYLLGRIYNREEQIESNLDGPTLRRILERAASIARATADQLGPISRANLFAAFNEVCGYEPDDQAVLALQRLPGLAIYLAEDESRCFIDSELANVCSGRELQRFIESPFTVVKESLWLDSMNRCDHALGRAGVQLVSRRLGDHADARGLLRQVVAFLNKRTDLRCMRGDISGVFIAANVEVDVPLTVSEVNFSDDIIELDATTVNLQQLVFDTCYFKGITLEQGANSVKWPHFQECIVERVYGRVSQADIPVDKFSEGCVFEKFDRADTSDAIRSGSLNIAVKVLIIALKKLFEQSGSGRKEGAFYRGVSDEERRYVPDILKLLKKHQFATDDTSRDGTIWLPFRKSRESAAQIINAPSECGLAIVDDARALIR